MAQEPVFQHSCLQPFVDHPTDDTIRDSSVKKRTQVGVRNRIEVFFDIEIYHPTQPMAHEASTQRLKSLMSRASPPEAVRAGKKVLLIDGLQHHDDRPLRHLVLKGWKAEGPKRSGSIALGDVYPSDRRRLITARLDALQEVRKIGLQVLRILGRRHTIDAGSTLLAGEPVGFPHPFQIEDVVQRGQCHPAFGSRQFSYPLSFRGQVCETQSSLPCFPSTVLSSRRPPFLDRVLVSPVPRRHQHYEGATTPTRRITGHLFVSLPVPTRFLQSSCSLRSAPGRKEASASGQDRCSAGDPSCPAHPSCGREWDLPGSQAVRPVPLPRSATPAELMVPRQ